MSKIKAFFLITSLAVASVSCTKIVPYYKADIQQGNDLSPAKIKQLKLGMSQIEVKDLLGDPVVDNIFNTNELVYVYTDKPNRKPYTERRLLLQFNKNKLVKINGDS